MNVQRPQTNETKHVRVPPQIGKYKVIGTIGKGAFAVVALAIDTKTNLKVAIKIIDRESIAEKHIISYLENELRLSARFNHPNIVKIYEVIYGEDTIMIVMEYLMQGDLQSLFNKGVHFSYEEQIIIGCKILDALSYLHKRGICHRDIKPENILFDQDMNPKLIDFRLSKENSSSLQTFCGTPFYIAPEIIMSDIYDGKKADMWAFGVTMHLLATEKYPWEVKSETHLFKLMQEKKLKISIDTSGIIGFIIEKCLVINPNERISSDELITQLEGMKNKNVFGQKIRFQKKTITEESLPKLHVNKNGFVRQFNIQLQQLQYHQQNFHSQPTLETKSALNFKNLRIDPL